MTLSAEAQNQLRAAYEEWSGTPGGRIAITGPRAAATTAFVAWLHNSTATGAGTRHHPARALVGPVEGPPTTEQTEARRYITSQLPPEERGFFASNWPTLAMTGGALLGSMALGLGPVMTTILALVATAASGFLAPDGLVGQAFGLLGPNNPVPGVRDTIGLGNPTPTVLQNLQVSTVAAPTDRLLVTGTIGANNRPLTVQGIVSGPDDARILTINSETPVTMGGQTVTIARPITISLRGIDTATEEGRTLLAQRMRESSGLINALSTHSLGQQNASGHQAHFTVLNQALVDGNATANPANGAVVTINGIVGRDARTPLTITGTRGADGKITVTRIQLQVNGQTVNIPHNDVVLNTETGDLTPEALQRALNENANLNTRLHEHQRANPTLVRDYSPPPNGFVPNPDIPTTLGSGVRIG